jgi:hypothetical protein
VWAIVLFFVRSNCAELEVMLITSSMLPSREKPSP